VALGGPERRWERRSDRDGQTPMRMSEKVFGALGVVSTIGAIISGFLGNRFASWVMLAMLLVLWQLWLTTEVLLLRKERTPPRPTLPSRALRYLDQPTLIAASKMNPVKIESSFILWSECTVMLWVLVPPKGMGLRDSPSNRYLLAHHTGDAEAKNAYKNQFCLRHSGSARWEFQCSNEKAEYGRALTITDGLEPGWHHLMVAWDRSVLRQVFVIDGGEGGNDLSQSSFESWPQRLAAKVYVGTWVSEWHGHFAETKLYDLVVLNRFVTSGDLDVKEHLARKAEL